MMGIRRFHIYREHWNPYFDQIVSFVNEPENTHDCYAVIVSKLVVFGGQDSWSRSNRRIELSRHILFAQSRGCSFKGQVKIEWPIRSPLGKGGLEIVCLVTASWTWKIGLSILQDFISSM